MLDRFTNNSKLRLDMKRVFRLGTCCFFLSWFESDIESEYFLDRYFEGIQGDNAKKGELFGINNIFKLHEDKLATKMAVSWCCDWLMFLISLSRSRRRIWQNWIGHWPTWMDREAGREQNPQTNW